MLQNMDPMAILEDNLEDYLIKVAILRKAAEIEGKIKSEERKSLSIMIGNEVSKTLAQVLI
jgi:hypothetical protein